MKRYIAVEKGALNYFGMFIGSLVVFSLLVVGMHFTDEVMGGDWIRFIGSLVVMMLTIVSFGSTVAGFCCWITSFSMERKK